ncbi:MAG: hypothetical protein JNL49_11180 [Bacteroidia bacterium]|nr:hypothetical protein [Bacteroidia bacterium]
MKKSSLYYGTLLLCILSFSQQVLSQTLTLTPSNYNGFNISCAGFADGSINMTITGGTPPYTIRWSNDMVSEDISGLQAGYYAVEVDDADSLTDFVFKDIMLTQPEPLQIGEIRPYIYQNGYNISDFGSCNGSVNYDVVGGVLPYSYFWEPSQQTIQYPTNLCAYENVVIVTDANGCNTNSGIGLSEPQRDDWTMNGNYNSNPTSHFIGTIDNKDLVFKTNNTERARIKANGEFSIARIKTGRIVSPDSLIYFGDSTIIMHPSLNRIYGDDASSGWKGTAIGKFANAPGLYSTSLGYKSASVNPYSVALGFRVQSTQDYSIAIGNGTSGQNLTNNIANTIMLGCNSNLPTLVISSANGIGTTGSVGIGITPNASDNSDSYKLVVSGKFGANEAWVSLGSPWPDYVFDEQYEIKSIDDLKSFVKEKHHLPGMPSASEISSQDKINLGEIQVKSIEKIEELYLYLFEMHEQILKLQNALNACEAR